MKSGNLLHKWGFGDFQSSTTVAYKFAATFSTIPSQGHFFLLLQSEYVFQKRSTNGLQNIKAGKVYKRSTKALQMVYKIQRQERFTKSKQELYKWYTKYKRQERSSKGLRKVYKWCTNAHKAKYYIRSQLSCRSCSFSFYPFNYTLVH